MGVIALKQPISPVALSRMLDLEKSSLSRNLRPLIESKLVISEGPREGGQSLSVTAKGRTVLQQALPAWHKAQAKIISLTGQDIVSKLDAMIARIGGQ
jgi:DNA-binding MarR family transcriptional regulator